jgi:hypothetical protein
MKGLGITGFDGSLKIGYDRISKECDAYAGGFLWNCCVPFAGRFWKNAKSATSAPIAIASISPGRAM